MAGEASVFQTGGGGFNYENYVQSSFLLQMMINGVIPSFPNGKIIEIGFQNKNKGYQTDDLFLQIEENNISKRVISQIKYNIPISSKNEVFLEVIKAFWNDFNNTSHFDKQNDKMFLIKSSLTNNDKNHIVYLCQIASKQSSSRDFFSEVNRVKIKKATLDIFEESLTLAKGKAVTKEELFQFLKCFHLLAYDFTVEASTDETYTLNLIQLSKSKDVVTTPKEIWSVILNEAAIYNRNGGSISNEDLKSFEPYKYFDLSISNDAYSSLKKIHQDGELLLKPFKNTIKGFHIDRSNVKKSIIQSLNQPDISIITGYPGVGKSSIVKDILNGELSDTVPIIFKADQLNKASLAQVFTEVGINYNLIDLFSLISTLPNKIIVIDGAEKLLEAQPDSAFKQLLSIISENKGIKLLMTCRSYAVNVIKQKFGIDSEKINVVDIPLLNDDEIELIKNEFPQLTNFLSNSKINEVLRSPKYLDFTVSAIKESENILSDISYSEFKEILWNEVIENTTVSKNGLPRKRGITFMHIAVGRAINMRLFFEPEDDKIDYEAVELLESDNIIVRNSNKFQFSPSHDILEDWALIRYITSIENKLSNKADLFNQLGNQPALRRAFRLWIEELLTNDIDTVANLISLTLEDDSIPAYWTDEILTAVFRSDNCSSFFKHFSSKLLKNNCVFLNRCILLIRTTCREYSFNKENSKDILFPVGSCWEEMLCFLSLNISEIESIRKSISNFLLDWEYKYIFQFELCSNREIEAANYLTFHYIYEMYNGNKHQQWGYTRSDYQKKAFVYMLFGFASFCKEDLKIFLEQCSLNIDEYGHLEGFSRLVIEKALGGVRNNSLIKELPDTLIQIANKHWKYIPPKNPLKNDDPFGFSFPERKEREDAWGITKTRFDFFPSGIYKTFVYNLLHYHPLKAIVFICDFTNYITNSYKDSEFGNKEELKEIKIILNDNKYSTIYGNEVLWNAYRTTVVTHYLLESILISLEKYLLEIAQLDITENKLLKSITSYLLENSNSAAIISVLTSVFIAYSDVFEDSILPVLKIREFYEWDTDRAIREPSSLEIYDQDIPYAQKEKGDFNRLPHRKKHQRGLRDFILYYQINVGVLNEKLHIIFDVFYKNCGDDILWEKAITEMDVRKYKASIVNKEKGVFQLEVNYTEPVQNSVEAFAKENYNDNLSMSYSHQLRQVREKKTEILFEDWKTIFNHFSSDEIENTIWDSPVTLSVLGLEKFHNKLSKTQKKYCVNSIIDSLQQIIKEANNRGNYSGLYRYNIMEKQLTTESIHLLYRHNKDIVDEKDIDILISYLLICHLADHETRDFQKYFRRVFSKKNPKKVVELVSFLIKYSKFSVENKFNYYANEKEQNEFMDKQFKFVERIASEFSFLDIKTIDFESNEAHFLVKALLLITPDTDISYFQDFILKTSELILNDLKLKKSYSFTHSEKTRKLNYTSTIDIRFYFNEVIMLNRIELGKSLIDKLCKPFFEEELKTNHYSDDIYELVIGVFNTSVTRLNDLIKEENNVEYYRNHFWQLWKYLFNKVKESGDYYFVKELLLDVNESYWSIKSDNWKGFVNYKAQYTEFIDYFKIQSLPHIISVFSTFGEKVFLPSGINLIVKNLKEDDSVYKSLNSPNAVKLIQVLFNNHIQEIKDSQSLIEGFIYILNEMIDLGYCEAYLIRECVITYKKVA
ncbi:ATP-binding protein [Tenacibaculum mesophilum]|uniref:ATP-binding protein n=1 Tax=Tenacibaculum mesophilum TaxID=104268 RepID=A0AAE9MRY5_9FLAO|nr:ATP-binding protein [Tenacibaculum mesophilum]UTD16570.1 ATP-binding protein [Tenacibaculum mesophilum]